MLHDEIGDRVQATFFLEQAMRRFERHGTLRKRTEERLLRLHFPVVERGGFADGREGRAADTPGGSSREHFDDLDERVVWWGWLSSRYAGRRAELRVRWIDPSGTVVQEEAATPVRRPSATATLSSRGRTASATGSGGSRSCSTISWPSAARSGCAPNGRALPSRSASRGG